MLRSRFEQTPPAPPRRQPTDRPALVATDKTVLRPQEAANILGISRASLYRLIAARGFPIIHVGGSVRIPVRALEQWMRDRLAHEQDFYFEGGA